MTRTAKNFAMGVALAAATVVLLCLGLKTFSTMQFRYWERTLKGPYIGHPCLETNLGLPSSTLVLESADILEMYVRPNSAVPLLTLKSPHGYTKWVHCLEARELTGASSNQVWAIHEMRLKGVAEASKSGYKILVSCDWDNGGKENGLIYLTRNASFEKFALGW